MPSRCSIPSSGRSTLPLTTILALLRKAASGPLTGSPCCGRDRRQQRAQIGHFIGELLGPAAPAIDRSGNGRRRRVRNA